MNNMNGAPMEKPVNPILMNFHKICEQFGNITEDENWSSEIKAEISKSKNLIAEIKEKEQANN